MEFSSKSKQNRPVFGPPVSDTNDNTLLLSYRNEESLTAFEGPDKSTLVLALIWGTDLYCHSDPTKDSELQYSRDPMHGKATAC